MSKLLKEMPRTNLVKAGILALFALVFRVASAQQQVLLYTEGFDNGPTVFVFDSGGIGSNHGSNDWTINNLYVGLPTYPNTPNEDSVVSGTINDAPYSNYMHIHDVTTTSVSNANWNPTNASDRFAYISSPFCTLGLTDVVFTFFWIGEGDSTAYGRVYYQANGGPWTQVGQAKYNDAPKWQYESLQSPAFNNVENLTFGFRWTNDGSDTTIDVSWGIDDVLAVGTYDNINNPVTISITTIQPDTVCQLDDILVGYSLSAPLCDGTYDIKMSDSTGSFTNSIDEGVFDIFAPDTAGFIFIQAPNTVEGNCFKIKIIRLSPAPQITSDTSICFAIQHCPVSIVTDMAPVMNDPDTTCVKSAIDVSFNSFGNFNANNVYYGQISDSNGSFAHPDTFGHLVSNMAYPAMPGDVSGLIPANLPPGCNYYIRIVSSNPAAIGTTIGPFCLKQCDVTTNNTQDIHVCINYPNATDTVRLTVTDHTWSNTSNYDTCNNWTVELLSMTNFAVVNIGGIGVIHDSVSGVFSLIIGPLATLPVAPGTYYMRIIDNCDSDPYDTTGSVIRITIGAPASTPATILSTQADSVYCNDAGLLELYVVPYNPNSIYFWNSNLFNGGQPIQEPGQIFLGNLTGAPIGDYVFYVREENFGCYGPTSAPYNYVITTTPNIHLTGPKKVCQGDTAIFSANYVPSTYYTWEAPPGVQVVQNLLGNNEAYFIFDSLGTYTIKCSTLNICGQGSNTMTVTVYSLFTVNAKPDKTVCFGDSVSLKGAVPPYPKTFISLDSSTSGMQGGMFDIIAHSDITVDSFAVSFRNHLPNTTTEIFSKAHTYRGFEQNSGVWNPLASTTIPNPAAPLNFTVIPTELAQPISAGDTMGFYITTSNSTVVNEAYGNGIGLQQGVVFASDGVIDFVQGCVNAYLFGASVGPRVLDVVVYYSTSGGLHYIWSNGDTTQTINFVPAQSGEYTIRVFDTTGCTNSDSVHVTVDTLPRAYAGPDTLICPYGGYIMPATASPTATVSWAPAIGLSQTNVLNPVFNYNQATEYVLTATNPDGCMKNDSVLLSVYALSVNAGPDTTLCDGETYVMQGSASTDSVLWYPSTGLSSVNVLNPTFSYNLTTPYILQVEDSAGCKLTDTVIITVEYCNAYIKAPDAFTPNGDGVNDYFTIFGKYIGDYQIKIYNRWGEEVYSSTDLNELNNLSRGWDGTYKGKLQDVGTFVYYITAKDLNGNNIFKKGNLTLIR